MWVTSKRQGRWMLLHLEAILVQNSAIKRKFVFVYQTLVIKYITIISSDNWSLRIFQISCLPHGIQLIQSNANKCCMRFSSNLVFRILNKIYSKRLNNIILHKLEFFCLFVCFVQVNKHFETSSTTQSIYT